MSQLKTDEDSLDWRRKTRRGRRTWEERQTEIHFLGTQHALGVTSALNRPLPALEPRSWAHTARNANTAQRRAFSYTHPFLLLSPKEKLINRVQCDF